MAVKDYEGKSPVLGQDAYVADEALVLGEVTLGEGASVWPMSVLRGDVNRIVVGKNSNIQDGSVCHVTHVGPYTGEGHPLIIGDEVTVGHSVVLHGAEIHNRCLIGIRSTVMDGAILEENVLLAAGSLVPPGKRLTGGMLWQGSPAKAIRKLTDKEIEHIVYNAEHYGRLREKHRC